jgi:hypothetical protein
VCVVVFLSDRDSAHAGWPKLDAIGSIQRSREPQALFRVYPPFRGVTVIDRRATISLGASRTWTQLVGGAKSTPDSDPDRDSTLGEHAPQACNPNLAPLTYGGAFSSRDSHFVTASVGHSNIDTLMGGPATSCHSSTVQDVPAVARRPPLRAKETAEAVVAGAGAQDQGATLGPPAAMIAPALEQQLDAALSNWCEIAANPNWADGSTLSIRQTAACSSISLPMRKCSTPLLSPAGKSTAAAGA